MKVKTENFLFNKFPDGLIPFSSSQIICVFSFLGMASYVHSSIRSNALRQTIRIFPWSYLYD